MTVSNVRPNQLNDTGRENMEDPEKTKHNYMDRPDHIARAKQFITQLQLSICWRLYQELLQYQNNLLAAYSEEILSTG